MKSFSIGILGVRGHVGKELLKLVNKHPYLKLDWISSRQLEGQPVKSIAQELDNVDNLEHLVIENLTPKQVSKKSTDIIILAMPNGLSKPFVEELDKSGITKILIDLSADHRFDIEWIYSLAELDASQFKKTKSMETIKISNPGCYATAMQLALAPIINQLASIPNCFGISGFSGAGTKPNPNNNINNLKDNILPYSLIEHLHEKEVSQRLKQPVFFTPHVADFFRGINLTVQVEFKALTNKFELLEKYINYYKKSPYVICKKEVPNIQQVVNTYNCLIGGFSVSQDGKRATIICCLDNLLKGAASQALQNINIALGIKQSTGLLQVTNGSHPL